MNKQYRLNYESPIGPIEIIGTDTAISSIMFSDQNLTSIVDHQEDLPVVLQECYRQLDEYFKGNRQEFTIPYVMNGTDFQQIVWNTLLMIPYGNTTNYRDMAAAVDHVKAIRAVGNANGRNKLSIIIPCHRVIGADGSLTGYAGGLWRKEWLLEHERKHFTL